MNKLIALMVSVLMAKAAFSSVTTHFALDCRDGAKVADNAQTLVYDASWYAGGVMAKITDNGREIVSGVSGTCVWTPTTDGVRVLTLNVYNTADNVVGAERVWCLGREDATELVIPDGTTEIGDYAFAGGPFTSVTIPASVIKIGENAFLGCENLKRVDVESLEDWLRIDFANEAANPLFVGADLYVGGERIAYRVVFEANCEIPAPPAIECKPGLPLGEEALPIVTRRGFRFLGWYTETNGGTKITANSIVDADRTLYAHWAEIRYTTSFMAEGGVVDEEEVSYQGEFAYRSFPAVTRRGFTFLGWYTAASGGTRVTEETIVDANRTLYAHWSDWGYELSNNGALLTGTILTTETLELPAEIDGHPVMGVVAEAFKRISTTKIVYVPEGVGQIGVGAFAGGVKTVYFLGGRPFVVDENGEVINADSEQEGIFGPYDEIADGTRVFYKQGAVGWTDGTWCGVPTSAGPEVTIEPGGKTVFSGSISVNITTPWENAVVHYTADGTEPTEDSPVFKKLTVNRKATIKATAISPDCRFHRVVTAQFGTGWTANPTISSSQGTTYYCWDNMISFSCSTPNVEYYYTLDGSDPVEHGTKYTGPFPIAESLAVKVVAKHPEYLDSDVVSKTFTRNRYTVATPQVRTGQGTPLTETVNTVTLSCSTDGSVIYYSTGGKYVVYTDPFKISGATTVSAYAVKDDWIRSSTNTVEIAKTWYDGSDVGMPGRVFLSEGGNVWTRDTSVKYDGVSSMRSAAIGDGETSDMQTSVTGKGTISFHWKTSCECDPYFPGASDRVSFCIDGVEEAVLDGETGWESFSKHIDTEGTHVLKWEYVKDESESGGKDCAWVDAISFAPDAVARIRFNGNENTSGELPTEITHYLGEAVTLPAQGSLARTRYDFVGWSDGAEVHSPGSLYWPPDADITLTAVWEPRISSTPTISVKGTYSAKYVKGYIYGSGNIYYTTDGTTPNETSMRYLGEFRVSGGTTVIKAIAIEDDKFPSAVASATTTCLWKSEEIGDVTWWYTGGTIVGVEGIFGKVVLPSKIGGTAITKLDESAFDNCHDLMAVVIPEGIVEIGDWCFSDCERLKTVVLPSTVTKIGETCFYWCTDLAQVYWCMKDEPSCGERIFDTASDSVVSYMPWVISTHLWNERAWTPWTPPTNGATGMIKEVIGDYALCTVTFDGNGGGVSEESRRVESGTAVGVLPVPWRSGYEFAGWFTAAVGGTQVTAATMITSDRTFFAQWKIVNYTITYELGGGVNAAGNPATYTVEQSVTLAAPTRSGYTFKGWTPNEGVIPLGSTGDRVFVASWVLAGGGMTYTLTFNANGGEGAMAGQTFELGRVYNLPKCTMKPPEGKTRFAGWAGSNGRRYDDEMLIFNLAQPGETIKMTAIWE